MSELENRKPNVSVGTETNQALIHEPMPEAHRITLAVFRSALLELHNDCRAVKRRSRAIPFLFTLALSALTALVYSIIGIVNYDSLPQRARPGHDVWLMYAGGVAIGGTAALILFILGLVIRGNFKDDLDDLMEKINVINYSSPVVTKDHD